MDPYSIHSSPYRSARFSPQTENPRLRAKYERQERNKKSQAEKSTNGYWKVHQSLARGVRSMFGGSPALPCAPDISLSAIPPPVLLHRSTTETRPSTISSFESVDVESSRVYDEVAISRQYQERISHSTNPAVNVDLSERGRENAGLILLDKTNNHISADCGNRSSSSSRVSIPVRDDGLDRTIPNSKKLTVSEGTQSADGYTFTNDRFYHSIKQRFQSFFRTSSNSSSDLNPDAGQYRSVMEMFSNTSIRDPPTHGLTGDNVRYSSATMRMKFFDSEPRATAMNAFNCRPSKSDNNSQRKTTPAKFQQQLSRFMNVMTASGSAKVSTETPDEESQISVSTTSITPPDSFTNHLEYYESLRKRKLEDQRLGSGKPIDQIFDTDRKMNTLSAREERPLIDLNAVQLDGSEAAWTQQGRDRSKRAVSSNTSTNQHQCVWQANSAVDPNVIPESHFMNKYFSGGENGLMATVPEEQQWSNSDIREGSAFP
ncbi:uncharacterized protein V1516DRAFT_15172 [Lipomyces oligophaga]|uniref:uncharacterized protein n=1 Tax=Lipomyces oligophaga TaxID=45792 RepID=UPI0034CFA189